MEQTRSITTPGGVEVVLKASITGGEDEDIQAVLEDSLDVDADQAGGRVKIPGSVLRSMRHAALNIVVISVGGAKDDILNRLRSLSREDYKLVCDTVDEVTEGISAAKKA